MHNTIENLIFISLGMPQGEGDQEDGVEVVENPNAAEPETRKSPGNKTRPGKKDKTEKGEATL